MERPCHVPDDSGDAELDPRIQIELEKLNNGTDDINKLEIELDEANNTFRLLLNDSTRRLKLLSKNLGSCIERARPYYEALEIAKKAQLECQKAAVQFQRANEIHQAAKETVALAEQRFISKQHEWQFDNAWQEMLNHATIKVMEAETQKAESGREHQRRAALFNAAEQKVQELEQRLRRSITRSRPYFEEKTLCQEQLATQKCRVESLQKAVAAAKQSYADTLRNLERISEEIHCKRAGTALGLREPGVGAELVPLPGYEVELDRCDRRSVGSVSAGDDSEPLDEQEYEDLEKLKQCVQQLETRPVEGGNNTDGLTWEAELKESVHRLHRLSLVHKDDCDEVGEKTKDIQKGTDNTCDSGKTCMSANGTPQHSGNSSPTKCVESKNCCKEQQSPTHKLDRNCSREVEDLELSVHKLMCNSPLTGSPHHISSPSKHLPKY